MTLDSEPGHGTCFGAYFPAVTRPARATEETTGASDAERLQGTATVLVVEDEDSVRAVMLRTLQAKGYEALEARYGKDALGLARACGRKIDLIVSDLCMPRMGGKELAKHLRSTLKEFKLLLTSGHFGLQEGTDPAADGATASLQKPFTPSTFARAVRGALDGN